MLCYTILCSNVLLMLYLHIGLSPWCPNEHWGLSFIFGFFSLGLPNCSRNYISAFTVFPLPPYRIQGKLSLLLSIFIWRKIGSQPARLSRTWSMYNNESQESYTQCSTKRFSYGWVGWVFFRKKWSVMQDANVSYLSKFVDYSAPSTLKVEIS